MRLVHFILHPGVLLAVLLLGFGSYLAVSSASLPDRVATHFDLEGEPNDWMSRSQFLAFNLLFGLAFPLFVPALTILVRWVPARFMNISHREYWLAPGRRAETVAYLFRQALWLGCLFALFVIGLHASIIDANRHVPARIENGPVWGLTSFFLMGQLAWVVKLLRHFGRPPLTELPPSSAAGSVHPPGTGSAPI